MGPRIRLRAAKNDSGTATTTAKEVAITAMKMVTTRSRMLGRRIEVSGENRAFQNLTVRPAWVNRRVRLSLSIVTLTAAATAAHRKTAMNKPELVRHQGVGFLPSIENGTKDSPARRSCQGGEAKSPTIGSTVMCQAM